MRAWQAGGLHDSNGFGIGLVTSGKHRFPGVRSNEFGTEGDGWLRMILMSAALPRCAGSPFGPHASLISFDSLAAGVGPLGFFALCISPLFAALGDLLFTVPSVPDGGDRVEALNWNAAHRATLHRQSGPPVGPLPPQPTPPPARPPPPAPKKQKERPPRPPRPPKKRSILVIEPGRARADADLHDGRGESMQEERRRVTLPLFFQTQFETWESSPAMAVALRQVWQRVSRRAPCLHGAALGASICR